MLFFKINYDNFIKRRNELKLVQRSLLHTGYFILENGDTLPAFTKDLLNEGMHQKFGKKIKKIYGVADVSRILPIIKFFKEKYGVIPQNLVAELRTGFHSAGELKQAHNLFIYK